MSFNTKSACALTGLSARQIDYWDRSHFIKPSVKEAAGQGSGRLYSFVDIVQLKVAKTLKDKGVSLQKIRKAINYLKKHFPDVQKPLAEMRFLTDGDTIFVLTKNDKAVLDTLAKGQMVFALALGEIIEQLKGDVKNISQDRKYKVSVKGKAYEVLLHADTEDGGYWVECPALAGCDSQGDTVEEALAMIKDAIKGHLAVEAERKKKRAVA
ncbi:MAG: MerR family transcriptional regulator [Nitrospirota bacterium]|nr:MerR family transcriptional regulator [Nitrospirota bacterium]